MTPINYTSRRKINTKRDEVLLASSRGDGRLFSESLRCLRVLSLDTKLAREVMVPRTDTLMLDVDDDISENLETILNCSYSRLPLYERR